MTKSESSEHKVSAVLGPSKERDVYVCRCICGMNWTSTLKETLCLNDERIVCWGQRDDEFLLDNMDSAIDDALQNHIYSVHGFACMPVAIDHGPVKYIPCLCKPVAEMIIGREES